MKYPVLIIFSLIIYRKKVYPKYDKTTKILVNCPVKQSVSRSMLSAHLCFLYECVKSLFMQTNCECA